METVHLLGGFNQHACALRVNGAPTALTAFARRLHSEVNLNNWQGPYITSPA